MHRKGGAIRVLWGVESIPAGVREESRVDGRRASCVRGAFADKGRS